MRDIDLDLDGTHARIIHHDFKGSPVKTFLVSFTRQRRALSTLEGFKEVGFVGNHSNLPSLWDFIHTHKKEYEERIYADLNVSPDEVAMLFTGADIDHIAITSGECNNFYVCVCVTAGVKSNAQRIGVDKAGVVETERGFHPVGTINIIVLTNALLTDAAMAGGIITITEAKTLALQDLDIRSSFTPEVQATGTGTDNIIVVSGLGPRITYVGGHAEAGELLARRVTAAVKEAIAKQDEVVQ